MNRFITSLCTYSLGHKQTPAILYAVDFDLIYSVGLLENKKIVYIWHANNMKISEILHFITSVIIFNVIQFFLIMCINYIIKLM